MALVYNKCYFCGSKENIRLHHLSYDFFQKRKVPKKYLIPLCSKCHWQLHFNYPKSSFANGSDNLKNKSGWKPIWVHKDVLEIIKEFQARAADKTGIKLSYGALLYGLASGAHAVALLLEWLKQNGIEPKTDPSWKIVTRKDNRLDLILSCQSMAQAAKQLGVSRERVRQIVRKAHLEKFKKENTTTSPEDQP